VDEFPEVFKDILFHQRAADVVPKKTPE